MEQNLIITGGLGDVGYCAAKLLSKYYNIYLVDKKSAPLKNKLGNFKYYQCDISKISEIEALVDHFMCEGVTFSALLNTAAQQHIEPFCETDFVDIDTNLMGILYFTQKILPLINKGGQILNITSVHATIPRKNHIPYDVSKAGLNMFSKELALELAHVPIHVNALEIGASNTSMNDYFSDEKIRQATLKNIPLKKIMEPMEVAETIVSIMTVLAKYSTGSCFVVDCGRSLV